MGIFVYSLLIFLCSLRIVVLVFSSSIIFVSLTVIFLVTSEFGWLVCTFPLYILEISSSSLLFFPWLYLLLFGLFLLFIFVGIFHPLNYFFHLFVTFFHPFNHLYPFVSWLSFFISNNICFNVSIVPVSILPVAGAFFDTFPYTWHSTSISSALLAVPHFLQYLLLVRFL